MASKVDYRTAAALAADAVMPVRTELADLRDCGGRILAEDITAAEDVPAFDRSPYDGYAFRAADVRDASKDTPVTLRIVEEIPAGDVPHVTVTAGTAARILTGAPLPPGADAIVKFEETEFTEDSVTLFRPYPEGSNIVRKGEDFRQGDLLARHGLAADAGIAGVLASQGKTVVSVYRRPQVALISTGSELVSPGTVPGPGQIRDSSQSALCALVSAGGCRPVPFGIAGDKTAAIAEVLEKALTSCDAVILTGGVSAGKYDLTPDAMAAAGVPLLFRGVAMKPGMACACGVKDGKLVLALSGNPAAAITGFHVIAAPALRKLCGRADIVPVTFPVMLGTNFPKKSPMTRFLRGRLDLSDGTARMVLPKEQGNIVLSSTIGCDVMAVVPAGSGPLEAGTRLEAFRIRG